MAKLRWTREAEQWLKDIHGYIARDNPVAAQKVIAGIYDRRNCCGSFQSLARHTVQSRKAIFESCSMAGNEERRLKK
jgi:plasmid stabilization system protein ParE